MLNQLNTTTKRELDAKYLSEASVYLDTEQKVGRFGDDDLYQITIDCGALPNATTKYVSTEISADKIISMSGVAITDPAGDDKAICLPLPFVGGSGTYVGLYCHILSTDYISLRITADADRSAYNGYVTLQYTKPTQP